MRRRPYSVKQWGARRIIAELLKKGWTKWQIKKRLFVHYNAVYNWERGINVPNSRHLDELRKLLKEPVPIVED